MLFIFPDLFYAGKTYLVDQLSEKCLVVSELAFVIDLVRWFQIFILNCGDRKQFLKCLPKH